jgi:RNA-directed DNA polymerase
MKRARIDLADIAAFDNLAEAAVRAARAKRRRPDVQAFFADLPASLERLGQAILDGRAPDGAYRRFTVHEPKRRVIHAACFADRVLHHAIMNLAAPVLERAMVPSSFACRPGKGALAAVQRAQWALRRFPWYVKVDVSGYFDAIDHGILLALLARRFKGEGFLDLMARIVGGYQSAPGKGLPIGSLTSQNLANYYLDGLDRFILEHLPTRAHVRYMDDIVWWCEDRATAKATLARVREQADQSRALTIKESAQVNRSSHGVSFLGYRILPGALLLSPRRRRQYHRRRRFWEAAWQAGRIDARTLQAAYAAVHGITAHADAREWRRGHLARFPAQEV